MKVIITCLMFFIISSSHGATPPIGTTPSAKTWQSWLTAHPSATEYLNGLSLSASPYLLQHAQNPINWVTWPIPQQTERLLFLSIGYASCHWCHQMNEHSFMDDSVAKILNKDYISIKVDRDEHPDVDYHYLQIQQAVTGNGGWPISIIALPDGTPVWLGSFEDAQGMRKITQRMAQIWKVQPDFLISQAQNIQSLINVATTVDTSSDFKTVFLKNRDIALGGAQADVKFPLEGDLVYMLNAYRKTRDETLKQTLVKHLNALAHSPLHDGVNGGFFRYATQKNWTQPHFEKMLYTQAQLLAIYSDAADLLDNPTYKQVASRIFNFLQTNMLREDGFYKTSINADWQGIEGGYYLWPKAVLASAGITHNISEIKGSGWQYFGLTGNRKLLTLQQQRTKPIADTRGISGLNGLVLWGLVKAAAINIPNSEKAAKLLANHLISNRFDHQGKLVRVCYSEDNCLSSKIDDQAYVALGLASYTQIDNTTKSHTDKLVRSLFNHLKPNDNFTNQDHETIAPLSAALMAANLQKLAVPFTWLKPVNSNTSASLASAKDNYLERYKVAEFARGHGMVLTYNQEHGKKLSLIMDKGWHINSSRPIQDYLIPTKVSGINQADISYPTGSLHKMGFSNEPLSLYEGIIDIMIKVKPEGAPLQTLTLQACNDKSCLPPQKIGIN